VDQVVEQTINALSVVIFVGQCLLFFGALRSDEGRQARVTKQVGEPLFQGLHGRGKLEPLTLFFKTVDVKVKVKLLFTLAT